MEARQESQDHDYTLQHRDHNVQDQERTSAVSRQSRHKIMCRVNCESYTKLLACD